MIKKRLKYTLVIVVFLSVVAGGFSTIWISKGPRRVERITPYHEKYRYEALIDYVESHPPESDTFKIAVLGDTRNNYGVAKQVYTRASLEKPDLIFNTGDLIRHGSVDELLAGHIPLLEITDPVPVFCVPGNHERGERLDYASYKALYGGTRFSFDYGPCRFVGFNASEHIRVDSGDLKYLERELSKPGATYKFVFFHIPPKYFEREVATNDRRGFKWNADELLKLLVEQEVTEVFMGHIHGFASKVIDGVRHTITAGGGAPLSERLPAEGSVHNYVVLNFSKDGIQREVVRLIDGNWVRNEVE